VSGKRKKRNATISFNDLIILIRPLPQAGGERKGIQPLNGLAVVVPVFREVAAVSEEKKGEERDEAV